MAWKPESPEIAVAFDVSKKLAEIHGARVTRVMIVYVVDESDVRAVSYGHTRQSCANTGKMLDRLFENTNECWNTFKRCFNL